jgi:hypothetical protein
MLLRGINSLPINNKNIENLTVGYFIAVFWGHSFSLRETREIHSPTRSEGRPTYLPVIRGCADDHQGPYRNSASVLWFIFVSIQDKFEHLINAVFLNRINADDMGMCGQLNLESNILHIQ